MRVFRPNTAAVAAKVIDGEAIIMNLTNGAYYSMDGVGGTVWEAIERGSSADEIIAVVRSRYAVEEERARQDLDSLVAQLLADDLIVSEDAASRGTTGATTTGTDAYTAPALNKYTEMADLLALDPPMPALSELPAGEQRG